MASAPYRDTVAHILVGADFHDAPLSFLEAGEARADDLRRQLAGRVDVLSGHVVIATCHRLEVYAEVKDLYPALDAIVESLADTLSQPVAVTGRIFRVFYESSVTRHLFSVASGLEAMVVGETEIAGQVKRSVDRAGGLGTLTPGLRRLFERAVVTSKRVHTEIGINETGRSLIDAAIDYAMVSLPPMDHLNALLIGTGAYARVVRAALARRGVKHIAVYSATGRADSFAASHGLEAVAPENLLSALAKADVVVSASGQSGHVITREMMAEAMVQRPSRGVSLIDLALARDIDPAVSVVEGCELVTLDDLKNASHHDNRRMVWEAEHLVDELSRQFADDERTRSIDPVVVALRENISRRVEEEIERVRRRHGDQVAAQVEQSLRRVTNALIHVPTLKGRDLALTGHEDDFAKAIRTLFDVEVPLNG